MWFIGKLSRDKRGAGSIIGAVFIVLILLSGFTFYTLNVNTTEHYNETLDSMNELDWKRNRENIVIKEVKTTDENKLNVTVENESPILAHIILLGIFNKTDNTQQYSSLNEYIEPAETENIVSDSTVIEGKKYVIQLVTELGNTVEHKFYPASEVNCKLTLIAAPPTAYKGNNVTVLFIVTHNDTEVDTIQSLTASLEAEPAGLVEVEEEPSSLSVKALTRGESAFFRWVYNTKDTGTVTFNATYEQAPAGTYALSTVEIISPPTGQGGEITITAGQLTTYLYPTDDAYVKENKPDNNYGDETSLKVWRSGNNRERVYIQFNLSSLPSGITISSATLELYRYDGGSSTTIGTYMVSTSWDEATITWNNAPTIDDMIDSISVDSLDGYKNWTVTSVASAAYLGSGILNMALKATSETGNYHQYFRSKEAGTDQRPVLEIIYTSPSDNLPYDTQREYSIKLTDAGGDPIPYANIAIYANGSAVFLKNSALDDLTNPCWVHTDANGGYTLYIMSLTAAGETFTLHVVCGDLVSRKTIYQEPES